MPMKDRRLGRFTIGSDIIEGAPNQVRLLMGRCIIVEAWYRVDRNGFQYLAACDLFASVEPGFEAPSYVVDIDDQGNFVATRDVDEPFSFQLVLKRYREWEEAERKRIESEKRRKMNKGPGG